MNSPTLTWEAICADPSLQDLPYKIETNRYNKIIMSPAANWHSDFQAHISEQLRRLLPHGETREEFAIQTGDGIRVPDVVWMSKERRALYRRTIAMPVAPEICIEVLSNANSREEMMEKMRLYFNAGAREVWLCDESGDLEFFTAASVPDPVCKSEVCPGFPLHIDID